MAEKTTAQKTALAPVEVKAKTTDGEKKRRTIRRRYDLYGSQIKQIMATHFQKFGTNRQVIETLNSMILGLQRELSDHVRDCLVELQTGKPKTTMQRREVQAAIRFMCEPRLANSVLEETDKVVKRYKAYTRKTSA